MSVSAQLMDQLHNANVLFNVRSERIRTASGLDIPNKKVIINDNTNTPMGVVGDGYKVVTNEEIFNGFTKSIEASGIDTSMARVDVLQTQSGSRSMVNFLFPAENISVDGDDSVTSLQISALNSYDGSTRYIAKAGGLRMKCLNGQILGKIVSKFSGTHSRNLDVDAGARQIMQMVQEFQNAKEYWGAMMGKRVGADEARKVMVEFLELGHLSYDELLQNRRYKALKDIARSYVAEMGPTVYALYNALTDYVTHTAPRSEASALTNAVTQQSRLAKVLDNNPEVFA